MRFTALLATASVAVTGVVAALATPNLNTGPLFGTNLSAANDYGAPTPPWVAGHKPGWYMSHSNLYPKLMWPENIRLPRKTSYTQTFSNLTGAIEASDYLTYGLVDTVADCTTMCDSVSDCKFINIYHDVSGKCGSPQLTCSLFSEYHNSSDATNHGGQLQPDGNLNYITDSEGWFQI